MEREAVGKPVAGSVRRFNEEVKHGRLAGPIELIQASGQSGDLLRADDFLSLELAEGRQNKGKDQRESASSPSPGFAVLLRRSHGFASSKKSKSLGARAYLYILPHCRPRQPVKTVSPLAGRPDWTAESAGMAKPPWGVGTA